MVLYLETNMREHLHPLLGNNHLLYRSYYYPCKGVIDGDLCQLFNYLDYSVQKEITKQLKQDHLFDLYFEYSSKDISISNVTDNRLSIEEVVAEKGKSKLVSLELETDSSETKSPLS